jgi:hypothetical protein
MGLQIHTMSNAMNIHIILILSAELAVLWWLFAWLYYDYRLDLLRFRLFLARDKLFCAAAEGKIAFDDPAYVMTRTTINGSLRFAHRLTLSKLVVTALLRRRYDPHGGARYHAKLEESMHNLSLDQKRLILDAHFELHSALLTHVAHVSLIIFPIALLFKLGLHLHLWRSHRFPKRARVELEPIDAHFFDLGKQPA